MTTSVPILQRWLYLICFFYGCDRITEKNINAHIHEGGLQTPTVAKRTVYPPLEDGSLPREYPADKGPQKLGLKLCEYAQPNTNLDPNPKPNAHQHLTNWPRRVFSQTFCDTYGCLDIAPTLLVITSTIFPTELSPLAVRLVPAKSPLIMHD